MLPISVPCNIVTCSVYPLSSKMMFTLTLINLVACVALQSIRPPYSSILREQSQLDFTPIRELLSGKRNDSLRPSANQTSNLIQATTLATTRATTTSTLPPFDKETSVNFELICLIADLLKRRIQSNALTIPENEMNMLRSLLEEDRSRTGARLREFFIPRIG